MTQILIIFYPFLKGNDGYAPLRYYVVQYSENNGPWIIQPEQVDPTVTAYTVRNLSPFTMYKFRIQAVNDIGPSGWSEESNMTKTLPSAPSGKTFFLVFTFFLHRCEFFFNRWKKFFTLLSFEKCIGK